MQFRGGYNITLKGKPHCQIVQMPEPEILKIPLQSKRLNFQQIQVKEGQNVNGGEVLAVDEDNFSLPLLAPRAGKVYLKDTPGHIVLKKLSKTEFAYSSEGELSHIYPKAGKQHSKVNKLFSLGVWQYFSDAHTGKIPDPETLPQAIVISSVSLEPFLARGDAQLVDRLKDFRRGLEHLQSLLEYQPIYLAVPSHTSAFLSEISEEIRGYAWAKTIEIPLKYPYDHPNIIARHLQLKKKDGPVWALRTEGVLAVDRALTLSKPTLSRVISVAGPAVDTPRHIKVMPGYPIKDIIDEHVPSENIRMILGGIFTGTQLTNQIQGLDVESTGITFLPENTEREFLGFMRPGSDRKSFAPVFLSALKGPFSENLTTATRGEKRPCIACNYCYEVCPAGIMPHVIHKYLYRDLLEEAEAARIDLCMHCGLCSYVCPSKIDLRQQFIEAQQQIEEEKEEARLEELKRQQMLAEAEEKRKAAQEDNE